jgi:hypothetical protein
MKKEQGTITSVVLHSPLPPPVYKTQLCTKPNSDRNFLLVKSICREGDTIVVEQDKKYIVPLSGVHYWVEE